MVNYLTVAPSIDSAEKISLPLKDNTIHIKDIEALFPGAIGLKFKEQGEENFKTLALNSKGNKYHAPPTGWKDKVFLPLYPIQRPPTETRSPTSSPQNMKSDAEESDPELVKSKIVAKLRNWLYVSPEGGGYRNIDSCVFVLAKKYFASAAHCFPGATQKDKTKFRIRPADKEENLEEKDWIEIQTVFVEPANVERTGADLIIFERVDGSEMANAPKLTLFPTVGMSYTALGYGVFFFEFSNFAKFVNSARARLGDCRVMAIHGEISSNFVDAGQHIIGDTGNAPGYSGGPVYNVYGDVLIGMITSRTAAEIDAIRDRPQPMSYILSSTYLSERIRFEERLKQRERELQVLMDNDGQ